MAGESNHAPSFLAFIDDLLERLKVDPAKGLSEQEVATRQVRYGANELRRQKATSRLVILRHQFSSVIIWLLVLAAGFSIYLGDLIEALAVLAVLGFNTAVGFFTELRASRSIDALRKIAEVRTRVRRGGRSVMVSARELVPGDIVLLEAGDVVSADLRLCRASAMLIDESVLTGEAAPVEKTAAQLLEQVELADRSNMAYKGTAVTRGTGDGVVVATGMQTELGRISVLAETAKGKITPLQERLDQLGQRLAWLTFGLAAVIVFMGLYWGHDATELIKTGVALAIAAVPEGLPVVATLCLARGMWRMAERNALIANLPSVETLGAATLILTDKTGTLTENQMTVVRYLLEGHDVGPTQLRGGIALGDVQLAKALRVGLLCTNASLDEGEGDGQLGIGDPMEIALLVAARDGSLDRREALASGPRVLEHAFDPRHKMMASVHTSGETYLFAVKGAPEAVLDRCTGVFGSDGILELDEARRTAWLARCEEAAKHGLRLLALATKQDQDAGSDPYLGLTLVGVACLADPVRADVPAAIHACQEAGVRVVMMTGDHADTAAAIARDAGVGNGELRVLEGRALAQMKMDAPAGPDAEQLLSVHVFARVTPEIKLRLVSFYQVNGDIVAVTGDGVNDAPALKKADIGIAMGQRGTQVAIEAADMILMDDSFATIVVALRQGRVIFGNIRRFVVYLLSCNVSELLIVGTAVGVGLPVPLLPLQILFLNLVTDVFPAFALGLWSGDDHAATESPRDPDEGILSGHHWVLVGTLGGVMTAVTLSGFIFAMHWMHLATDQAMTVAFVTLALAQLWNVFNVRAKGSHIFCNEITCNPAVWASIAFCLLLIAAALWCDPLAKILGLPNPGIEALTLAFGLSVVHLVLGQLTHAISHEEPAGRPINGSSRKLSMFNR